MIRRLIMAATALMLVFGLTSIATPEPADALFGNLNAVDNCTVARDYLETIGTLGGGHNAWIEYEVTRINYPAYGRVSHLCRVFTLIYGGWFADFEIWDGDVVTGYAGADNSWSISNVVFYTVSSHPPHLPGTAWMCEFEPETHAPGDGCHHG